MGEHEEWAEPSGLLPNGLVPNAGPVIGVLDSERWAKAEERTAELIACIKPNQPSEERRNAVADYVQRLIMKCFPCQVFTFGSVPLKTYLPDGDIDLTAFSNNQSLKDTWAHQVRDMLEKEEKNENAEFHVKEVQYIQAEKTNTYPRQGNNSNTYPREGNNNSNRRPSANFPNTNQPWHSGKNNQQRYDNTLKCQLCDRPGHSAKVCRSRSHNRLQARANYAARLSIQEAPWIVDTSATHHMAADVQNFTDVQNYHGPEEIAMGDGSNISISHTGSEYRGASISRAE